MSEITEWLLDKVITVPAENLVEPAAIAYFIIAPPVIAGAALGGYAADEINHYIVHPTAEIVDAIRGAFADDDVGLFPLDILPSGWPDPALASDEVPAGPGAGSYIPADDELPPQQGQYAPAEDELTPRESQPVNADGEPANAERICVPGDGLDAPATSGPTTESASDTSPSAGAVPASVSDELPAAPGAGSYMPADDELPLHKEQHAPADDELPAGDLQPVNTNEGPANAAGPSTNSAVGNFFEGWAPARKT